MPITNKDIHFVKRKNLLQIFFIISWNWRGVNQSRPKYTLFKLPYNLCGFILQVIWAEEAQLTKNCKVNLDVTGIYCHSLGKIDTMGSIILWKFFSKVEKILKGSLDLISSPSPSVKIQIMGGKVCLRFKGKTLLRPSNVLLFNLKQTFCP